MYSVEYECSNFITNHFQLQTAVIKNKSFPDFNRAPLPSPPFGIKKKKKKHNKTYNNNSNIDLLTWERKTKKCCTCIIKL